MNSASMRLPIKPQTSYYSESATDLERDIYCSLIAACIGSAGSSGENSRKNINWSYPGKILTFFCLIISFAHKTLTLKSYVNMTYSSNMFFM